MTSAVSSTLPQAYVPPTQPSAATVGAQAETTTAADAATPASLPVANVEALLSDSTMSALVAQQSAPEDAAAADPAAAAPLEHWSSYEFYMPVRPGFTSRALALAIDDPNAVSSSVGKTDDEIATDARARLDANYARMAADGQPFKENTFEGVDWNSLFGELDPKSLAAVQQNRGGLFTEQEQTYSRMFLDTQAAMRAGAYCGPTRLAGVFYASGASSMSPDQAADAMKGWDQEAAKDKTNVGMQLGRAAMRVMLGQRATDLFGDGKAPEDRMMSFLVDALKKAQATDPDVLKKIGDIRTAEDLEKQDWFKDDAQQFEAIRQILDGEAPDEANPGVASSAPSPQASA